MGSDQTVNSETEQFLSPPSYTQVSAHNPFEQGAERKAIKSGWTLNLILCCLCAATASFQFGYNISSLNSSSTLIKHFIGNHTFLFNVYWEKKAKFDQGEAWLNGNRTMLKENHYQVEQNMARVVECSSFFGGDENCEADVAEIMKKSAEKKKILKEKFNWTGE
jgi:hypothetical protein